MTSPSHPHARSLKLLLLLWILLGTSGRLAAQAAPQALARFLLAPLGAGQGDPPQALVAAYRDAQAVAVALKALRSSQPAFGPGFHLLQLPASGPEGSAALVVPRHAAVPGHAAPLLVVSEPERLSSPPDELPLRALYAAWLQAGWVVLAPRASPFGPPGRRPPPLAALLAAASLRLNLDRERMVLLSPPSAATTLRAAVTRGYVGETTPFAALHEVLPGASIPDRVLDLEAWGGRTILLHLSEHNPDAALVHLHRLQQLQAQGLLSVLLLRDPALNWEGHLSFRPELVLPLVAGLKRQAPGRKLSFTSGGASARRHEWLEAPGLETTLRLMAEQHDHEIDIRTPDQKEHEPFTLNIYLPSNQPIQALHLNDHPLSFEGPTQDTRSALLIARYELQTGRKAAGVLRVRP